jgi:hypothetical protein
MQFGWGDRKYILFLVAKTAAWKKEKQMGDG